MRLFSIASGSSGNCIYVGHEDQHLLVDAGISAKRIIMGLADNGIRPEQLAGILVTHEHSDHISGISVLVRKYEIPIYATPGTLLAIQKKNSSKPLPKQILHPIQAGESFSLGDMKIHACPVHHDASEPVAYSITCNGVKAGLATDLGCITEEVLAHLRDSKILYLESNYDRSMLLAGSYPYSLKQRILSVYGHLSNDDTAELFRKTKHEQLEYVVLAHLSKENNYPMLAYQTMRNEIDQSWDYATSKPELIVADRDKPITCISV